MDLKGLQEGDSLIDLESGMNAALMDQECHQNANQGKKKLIRVHSGFRSIERSTRVEEPLISGCNSCRSSFDGRREDDHHHHLLKLRFETDGRLEKKVVATEEMGKKTASKKPPKPPRPPKSLSLVAGDEKLVQEISILKRARIERIKALKRKKNAKAKSSSSNLWAMIVTVIFCLIIVWQAM
ncbi:hypothetical protein IHE45_06G007500 [Dioscorea alata]|uniref:Uncharacterized protein n=2 Tax=Dioscorea alata TaxID=55571 RepID=A0ACB7VVA1_DIOAL|nr:hypothetical protein IHE45_06G007500 [Dioscorea alata]KAH7678604.1 hypothetical protein IHE45_06G007500 [Dioscorea alata]